MGVSVRTMTGPHRSTVGHIVRPFDNRLWVDTADATITWCDHVMTCVCKVRQFAPTPVHFDRLIACNRNGVVAAAGSTWGEGVDGQEWGGGGDGASGINDLQGAVSAETTAALLIR